MYAHDIVSVHHTGGNFGFPSRIQHNFHAVFQNISYKITAESTVGHKTLGLWPAGTQLVNVRNQDPKKGTLKRFSSSLPGPVPFCRAN